MRDRPPYDTVDVGGRELVVVQYLANDYITLVDKKQARKLWKAGDVGIMGPEDWATIKSNGGAGLNVDPAYL